jgi:hypothetical protein
MALTALQFYKMLIESIVPASKKDCRECTEPTCLKFAMNVVNKSISKNINDCPYIPNEWKSKSLLEIEEIYREQNDLLPEDELEEADPNSYSNTNVYTGKLKSEEAINENELKDIKNDSRTLPISQYQSSANIEENELNKRLFLLKENMTTLLKSIPEAHSLYEIDYQKFRLFLNKSLLTLDKISNQAMEMRRYLTEIDGEEFELSPNVNFPVGFLRDEHPNSFFQKNIVSRYQAIYYNTIFKLYEYAINVINVAINDYLEKFDEVAIQDIYYNFNVYKNSGASDQEKMISPTDSIGFNWFAIEIVQDFVANSYSKDNLLEIFKIDSKKGLRNSLVKGNPITEILMYHPNYGGLFITTVGGNNFKRNKFTNDPIYNFLSKGNFNFLGQFSETKSVLIDDKFINNIPYDFTEYDDLSHDNNFKFSPVITSEEEVILFGATVVKKLTDAGPFNLISNDLNIENLQENRYSNIYITGEDDDIWITHDLVLTV